ncbi:Enolase-phosphatase E1 [uncultured archaeon]|nr:Enolase-phosphatase E1 [uncultured archaeon]
MIKAVLWDIGGVLLADPKIGEFWEDATGSKELRHKFGSGKISKEDFTEKASAMLNIKKNEFLDKYAKAYYPITKINPVVELYNKTKCKRYLFSDTNPLHLNFIKTKYPEIFENANGLFLSSEIGSRKQDEETYRLIIKKLNVKPNEILFIDDKQSVLDIAAKYGIKGMLFTEPKTLNKNLAEQGLV